MRTIIGAWRISTGSVTPVAIPLLVLPSVEQVQAAGHGSGMYHLFTDALPGHALMVSEQRIIAASVKS